MSASTYKKLTDIADGLASRRVPKPVQPESAVVLVNGADIEPKSIRWLWNGWLAQGKLHVLAGAPGQGKTTLALQIMGIVSIGGRWPDGSRCEPGNVLIWSGEDDPEDTLLPRLIAMGADVKRVFFVKGARIAGELLPFDPARDLLQLSAEATRIGSIRLLVVDPVVSAVAGDSHKNTEVRRALQPLVDLAAALDCAVLGISHFAKGGAGKDPTERVVGSVAFSAVARVVMVAAKVKDEQGEDRRILARSKSNIGPDDGGIEYSLDQAELPAYPGVFASRVVWGAAVAGTARELLAEAETDSSEVDGSSAADVDAFLRSLLTDGPMSAAAIKKDVDGAGYAWRTVQRSATRLRLERRKDGMKGGWMWCLPPETEPRRRHEGAEDANFQNVAPSASSVAPSGDGEVF